MKKDDEKTTNIIGNEKEKNEEKKKFIVHPELPQELSFLKIVVPTDKYLPSPKPWQKVEKKEALPPPKIVCNDFNRCAKGFLGTYISPYQRNNEGYMYETCDL